MPEQAKITSIEAIEQFRAALILYLSQARPALDEISGEIVHTKVWLQNDQRRFLESEMRKRSKKLEEAQQELFSARLSNFQETTSLQQMAVQRMQREVRELEEKLKRVKKWERELENHSDPLVKSAEQFQTFLTIEMPKAIAYLAQVVKTLEAYSGVALPGSAAKNGETA
jgi:chromosome segregation ATPase